MKIYVETERLILREILSSDAEALFELDSDPLVHRYLGNKPIKSIEAAQKAIANIRAQYLNQGIGRWAVIEKSSGDFMGWSGLKLNFEKTMNKHSNFYDIGYRLMPRFWGKGYATESAIAAMDYGFNILNIETIVGLADVENLASNAILKKIGLKYIEDFPYEKVRVSWYELKKHEYGEALS